MVDLAIAAVHRGEDPFLREWIEYHRMIGVGKFFLYNHNRGEDRRRSRELLRPYVEEGVVWDLVWPVDYDFQMAAYEDAANVARGSARWLLYLDLDEFLYPLKGASAPDHFLASERFGAEGLCLTLATFGSGGLRETPPLVSMGLTRRAVPDKGCNWTCKYAIRLDAPKGLRIGERRFVDEEGRPRDPMKKELRPCRGIRVNHYPIKSEEWWAAKVARSWPDGPRMPPMTAQVWDHKRRMADHNDVYDDSMLRFHAGLVERLGGDPAWNRPSSATVS